jgi:hypothetical protein
MFMIVVEQDNTINPQSLDYIYTGIYLFLISNGLLKVVIC